MRLLHFTRYGSNFVGQNFIIIKFYRTFQAHKCSIDFVPDCISSEFCCCCHGCYQSKTVYIKEYFLCIVFVRLEHLSLLFLYITPWVSTQIQWRHQKRCVASFTDIDLWIIHIRKYVISLICMIIFHIFFSFLFWILQTHKMFENFFDAFIDSIVFSFDIVTLLLLLFALIFFFVAIKWKKKMAKKKEKKSLKRKKRCCACFQYSFGINKEEKRKWGLSMR